MASPLKKSGFEGIVATTIGGCAGKMFIDEKACHWYNSDLCHRQCSSAHVVDFDFFLNAGSDSFTKFEAVGWGPFFTLNEPIYLEMVKEFYANLSFDDNLQGTSIIKGRKIVLTPKYLT